ncbi:MAG: LexA family protein [Fusobacteriaceae bacterium]
MYKTEFSRYLSEFLMETGYKLEYVSTKTNASLSAVGFYKNGDRTPKDDFIDNFIKAFSLDEEIIKEIIARDRTPKNILTKLDKLEKLKNTVVNFSGREELEMMRVPLYSSVSAGIGKFPEAVPIDYIDIPKIYGEVFSVVVDGDSMEPKIKKGDIIVVKKNEEIKVGEIGIFILNREFGDAVVKRLKYKNGIHVLESDNINYEDIKINTKDVVFCGKVIFIIKKDLKKENKNLLQHKIENLNSEQRKIIEALMNEFDITNKN